MNNNNRGNNNNNNRRRGRGNRQQGGNGGQQLNRIDSRARGNAPQLLEKYRKLAQDAHLNGDRVSAEYYLQFADHYFRVIADGRQRVEEQRLRREDRWEGGDEQSDDAGDFSVDNNDFPSFDQPTYQRQQRDDRPQRDDRSQRDDRPQRDDRSQRDDRPQREERQQREDRPRRDRDEEPRGDDLQQDQGGDDEGAANPYEPPENPFVRADRPTRGLRPRRDDRRPRRDDRGDNRGGEESSAGLDPSLLPPSIGLPRSTDDLEEAPLAADAKPKRGRPRKRPAADESGEALETVG